MLRLPPWPGLFRPLIASLLYICAWVSFPPAYAGQPAPADPQSFAATARRAIAHGRSGDAEAMARQRPPTDGAAAGVLGQILVVRGRLDEALPLLEGAAQREPASEAALQLGLLQQHLGRRGAAQATLNRVLQAGAGARAGARCQRTLQGRQQCIRRSRD